MPLSAGDRLGPYEILAPIGAGGMGEVYRAKDTKLDREVAIKVLPAALAQDPERLARFEREAKVLASLNHPNIAQIYGVEESHNVRALVMELVPGALLKVPLPLETALNYAKQIADALEAAHDKGIIHRDLKPANIMITPEGIVKLLDFGLAAVTQPPAANHGDPSNSPTLTMGGTEAGMILGTPAYMSPEQAAGKPVDKRADIWSFGVVFFEMLTGRRLFDSETLSHALADVLRAPIDFNKVPKETPKKIHDLLRRCLDRDIKNRLRDIGEARVVISRVSEEPEATELAPAPSRLGKLPWAVAGILGLAVIVFGALSWRAPRPGEPKPAEAMRTILLTSYPGTERSPTFSPDGRQVAFVWNGEKRDNYDIYVKLVDGGDPLRLTHDPADDTAPAWSPDGRFIAFVRNGSIFLVPPLGGVERKAADAVTQQVAWTPDCL